MLTFHYSDSWADPGQQTKPAYWASHSVSQLATDVYAHTQGTLRYLKDNGIDVEWVQVGNEINDGMLWPEGRYTVNRWPNLVRFINSGYDAVKSVYPNAKVVLHLANGHDNALFRWFFDGMRSNGAKYDVIGLSHYPNSTNWTTRNSQLNTNMKDMVARYNKPVLVAETGMDWQQAAASKASLADVLSKVQALGSSRGLGVFYWEPQAHPGWKGYTWGALDGSGRFTVALDPY
jgi:arabinogalactan endo-1,4-beta-galactosidase